MKAEENYYRRSYNAINKLIEAYKNGYTKETMLEFRKSLQNEFITNNKVAKEKFNNTIITMMIALLGLNKEAIEQTKKFYEYKRANNLLDMSEYLTNEEEKTKMKDFNNQRVISTDFDDWLSIKINPETDKNNIDYLRRVRNSLLHSNFKVSDSDTSLPFINLKTKSYYEADILSSQFQMFVFEYFGNIEGLGLTESTYTFTVQKAKITNNDELKKFLTDAFINKISYKNLTTVGLDSPELLLMKSLKKDIFVDMKSYAKKLKEAKNFDNLLIEEIKMNEEKINQLIHYVEKLYGNAFYKLDYTTQISILSTHIKYELNPKFNISNWISHFWYVYMSALNPNFQMSFFDGDDFSNESCLSSLLVLKAYLIMYRLQNNEFDNIDYEKMEFEFLDPNIYLLTKKADESEYKRSIFEDSLKKQKAKNNDINAYVLFNKICCEVVRDSLAHGNVRIFTDDYTLIPMIELKDIDPKSKDIRLITMPISKFNEFLNDNIFSPKNCYIKEEEKVLKKEK